MTDATGKPAKPLYLKLLAVLRVLGRGECFDSCCEDTNISAEALRVFFHWWIDKFVETTFQFEIREPIGEEINVVMKEFADVGIPGAVGSADCAHVRWDKCPAKFYSYFKGKEPYASIAYEVTVTHKKRIIAVSSGHYGSMNDKTIVRFDDFICRIKDKRLYDDIEFELYSAEGGVVKEKGLYLIVDGGYHKWRVLQCPYKHAADGSADKNWSERFESVRKDVECTFGILKKRFANLKNAMQFQKKHQIDAIFKACCILHNMLLEEDGYDWYNNDDNEGEQGEEDGEVILTEREKDNKAKHDARVGTLNDAEDFSRVGGFHRVRPHDEIIVMHGVGDEVAPEYESDFHTLRNRLVEHFNYMYNHGRIRWTT